MFLPVPGLNILVTVITMVAKNLGTRQRNSTLVARENARNAANWALTMLVTIVVSIALLILTIFLITEPSASGSGRTPVVPGSDLIVLAVLGTVMAVVGIMHLVFVIKGMSAASRGQVFAPRVAIPFFRSPSRK